MIADLLVQNAQGEAIAVVEVKNPVNLSVESAAHYREAVAKHHGRLGVRFLLLVSQDVGYLWNRRALRSTTPQPSASFPMKEVIGRLYGAPLEGNRLPGESLQYLVHNWLEELALGKVDVAAEPGATLAKAGFLDSILGAQVLAEVRI